MITGTFLQPHRYMRYDRWIIIFSLILIWNGGHIIQVIQTIHLPSERYILGNFRRMKQKSPHEKNITLCEARFILFNVEFTRVSFPGLVNMMINRWVFLIKNIPAFDSQINRWVSEENSIICKAKRFISNCNVICLRNDTNVLTMTFCVYQT